MEESKRADLVLAHLNGYVCESAVIIASAHKLLGIVRDALLEAGDSAHADYMLARVQQWNADTQQFANTYGKIGDDMTFLKRTCSQ